MFKFYYLLNYFIIQYSNLINIKHYFQHIIHAHFVEAECLYKHWNSRYNANKRGVSTPESPSVVCIDLNTPPYLPKQDSRASTHSKKSSTTTKSHGTSSRTSSRASSVKVPKFSTPPHTVPTPPPETGIKTSYHGASMPPARPKKAWALNTEATPIVVPSPVPHPPTPPRIYSPTAVGQPKAYTPSSPVPVSDTQIKLAIPIALSPTTQKAVEKKPRIQSAPPQRPAVTPKLTRAIRSAGKSTVTL